MKYAGELWSILERHSRAITVIPVFAGLAALFITGRVLFFHIGVVCFLLVISVFTAVEGYLESQRQRQYDKRAALATRLKNGGYSLCAASMAAYFAISVWTLYRPRWLVYLMFTGLAGFFASALVPRRAKRKPST